MQTFTANEAKTRFGELLDCVQRAPVQVTRHNRVVGVMGTIGDRPWFSDSFDQPKGKPWSVPSFVSPSFEQFRMRISDD